MAESSTSSVAVAIPTCLPISSQSAVANTMVAIFHDYTNSQVRLFLTGDQICVVQLLKVKIMGLMSLINTGVHDSIVE